MLFYEPSDSDNNRICCYGYLLTQAIFVRLVSNNFCGY